MVDDQLNHDLHVSLMGRGEESLEVVDGAITGIYVDVVGYVIAVVSQWRRKEREQPETGNTKLLKVVEARDEARKVTYAIAVGVLKGADVKLINDCVLIPEWICCASGFLSLASLCFQV